MKENLGRPLPGPIDRELEWERADDGDLEGPDAPNVSVLLRAT